MGVGLPRAPAKGPLVPLGLPELRRNSAEFRRRRSRKPVSAGSNKDPRSTVPGLEVKIESAEKPDSTLPLLRKGIAVHREAQGGQCNARKHWEV